MYNQQQNRMIQRLNLPIYPETFTSASLALQQGHHKTAASLFLSCLEQNPASYSSYLNLAYIHHLHSQYSTAISLCDVAIYMRPYCGLGYYNRCLALASRGQEGYSEAMQDIDCAIGCLYLEKGKQNGEIRWLKMAVQCCENMVEAVRLLLLLSKEQKEKKYYKGLLRGLRDGYKVAGHFTGVKDCYADQCGIFRLKANAKDMGLITLQKLQQKISQYVKLSKQQPDLQQQPKMTEKINRNSSITLESCTYQLTIQTNQHKEDHQQQNEHEYQNQCNHSESNRQSVVQQYLPLRHTTKELPLRDTTNNSLNVPSGQFGSGHKIRYSLVEGNFFRSPVKSVTSSVCSGLLGSRYSRTHTGCPKCQKQTHLPPIPQNPLKLQIKTVQIFRSENLATIPKPYLIFYDGVSEQVSQMASEGGHFPKWNTDTYYLSRDCEGEYRIQLWNRGGGKGKGRDGEKEDQLVGVAGFGGKMGGRFKCYFVKNYGGTRRTGYIYIHLTL